MKLETCSMYMLGKNVEDATKIISLCRIFKKSRSYDSYANYCFGFAFLQEGKKNKISKTGNLFNHTKYKYNLHVKLQQIYTI